MSPTSEENRRGGALLLAGLLLVVAGDRASGQPRPVESPSNVECLERLEIPEYPPVARAARIQAIQTVKLLLSDQATIQNVEQNLEVKAVSILEKYFRESAEKALKSSRFSKTCGGKTITLVFHYELRDDPNTSSLFAFGPPNHFWIRYGPVYVMQ